MIPARSAGRECLRTARAACLGLAVLGAACGAAPAQVQRPAQGERPFEVEIRRFEEEDRRSPPPPHAVLFTGSSSIRLWSTLARDFEGIPVIQRGFGGSQMADLVHYAPRIVLPYRPGTVLVYEGDNDIASGKTPRQVHKDWRALVGLIHRELPSTHILFISIKPSPARWRMVRRVREANALIRRHCSTDRRLGYVDVFTRMLGRDGRPRRELFLEDGLHLNAEGYALWTRIIRPLLRRERAAVEGRAAPERFRGGGGSGRGLPAAVS